MHEAPSARRPAAGELIRCVDTHAVEARLRWLLHDTIASRALERTVAATLPPHALMQRAGAAVARLARAVAPHARRVWVLAGPGNNGGDGFEAAAQLRRDGCNVSVTCMCDPRHLPAAAASAYERARQEGVPVTGVWTEPQLGQQDLIVDALLGLGVSRPPDGALAHAISAANGSAAIRLAVDLPSGLSADTGHIKVDTQSQACIRAHHTLSLLTLKPGLFTADGRDHAGRVWFCDLGCDPASISSNIYLAGTADVIDMFALRRHAGHKGSYGTVAVIGGARGMVGAALLAARSALRRGAGRVLVQLLDDSGLAADPMMPELMLRQTIDWHERDTADTLTAVCGCGGGDRIRAVLPVAMARAAHLVLDADALNAIAADPGLQGLLEQRGGRGRPTVLTPHPLEAARLLGRTTAQVQGDRVEQARQLASRFGATVLLKGSGSITATPEGRVTVNPTGSARLATAGTGDVLAGWVGALLAQGIPPEQACVAAAFAHGLRADTWPTGAPAFTASEL